jgi:hypothetical protein
VERLSTSILQKNERSRDEDVPLSGVSRRDQRRELPFGKFRAFYEEKRHFVKENGMK